MSDDLRLLPYDRSMSEAALALERACPQGHAVRLRFERETFHRRADNFDRWRMVTAWRGDRLVGIAASAIKPAQVNGEDAEVAYFFDVRVAREERRTRVAQRLIEGLADEVVGKVALTYGYTVGDNRAAQRLTSDLYGNAVVPAFRILAYPVAHGVARANRVRECGGEDVHARYAAAAGPFDLDFDPSPLFANSAYRGSWTLGDMAGASAWSNAGIFAEVVERLPRATAALARLLRMAPFDRLGLPRLPLPGEAIRSWYLFDVHARDAAAARELIAGITAHARPAGIDYLYLIHRGDEPWIDALRPRWRRAFAPIIPYCVLGGAGDRRTPVIIDRPYIDVRDV